MDKKQQIRREVYTPGLHIREAAEGEAPSRTIVGYAVMFGVPSRPMWRDDDSEGYEMISRDAVTREFLDNCDIKMTMYHDRHIILARSKAGEGTLSYEIDDKGVMFTFDAPKTQHGDEALELVRRGDIQGCSFAFSTPYYDNNAVERSEERKDGKLIVTYTVRSMTGIYDFTLTDDPAYEQTCVEAREAMERNPEPEPIQENNKMREQVHQMRCAANSSII